MRRRTALSWLFVAFLCVGCRTASVPADSAAGTERDVAAPNVLSSGELDIVPATSLTCRQYDLVFEKGQEAIVSGDGFAPSVPVEIGFQMNAFRPSLGTFESDADGKLSARITVPAENAPDYPPQAAGMIEASGASPNGTRWLTTMILAVTPTGDNDSDGVPNHCDNCPDTPNRDQGDEDDDDVGDACDHCPGEQDSDSDGMCDSDDPCWNDPENEIGGDRCKTPYARAKRKPSG